MEKSNSIAELAKALCAAQGEMPKVERTNTGQVGTRSYNYAPLDEAMAVALPLLTKHGLSIAQKPDVLTDGQPCLTTILMHTSGEFIAANQPLLLAQNTEQAFGSAVTYSRRYGLMAAIGMVAEADDDGSAASAQNGRRAARGVATTKAAAAAPAPKQAASGKSGQSGTREITLKQDGQCSECRYPIAAGERAMWNPEKRGEVYHPEGKCHDDVIEAEPSSLEDAVRDEALP